MEERLVLVMGCAVLLLAAWSVLLSFVVAVAGFRLLRLSWRTSALPGGP
jgi:hypothetical protein